MDSSVLPLITGGGGAIVVLCLWVYAFYTGKVHSDAEFTRLEEENAQLREEAGQYKSALESERRALNEAAQAGQVTNQLITALTVIAAEKHKPHRAAARPGAVPGLTAPDPGP